MYRLFGYLTFIFSFVTIFNSYGQNLVPNPSFEEFDSCPSMFGQISFAKYWSSPTSNTPDYFNSCDTNPGSYIDVPQNSLGYQYPKSGNCYTGIGSLYSSINGREYIHVGLISPLSLQKKYIVSLYVSLCDSCFLSLDKIGVYFSSDSIDTLILTFLPVVPQIQNQAGIILDNKSDWTLLQDTLLANGSERYLTIGTFLPDSLLNVDTIPGGIGPLAYYYIDDVSVVELTTGIDEVEQRNTVSFNPNPSTGISIVSYNLPGENNAVVQVFDLLGNKVKSFFIQGKSGQVETDLSELRQGIYFYSVDSRGKKITSGKIVIINK